MPDGNNKLVSSGWQYKSIPLIDLGSFNARMCPNGKAIHLPVGFGDSHPRQVHISGEKLPFRIYALGSEVVMHMVLNLPGAHDSGVAL